MRKFTKIVAPALFAALAMGAVSPAFAAPGWALTPARSAQIRQDINQLNGQIDQAARRRTISAREAGTLRAQARDVQRLYASYSRGGLTRPEVQTLQNRVNQVRAALRMERRDWDGRPG